MSIRKLNTGVVKRREKRVLGVFIDGVNLDRATRRIKKKVDLSALLRGVTAGTPPKIARYYTLIPYEDDSRQHSFLDAVSKAGFDVVVKRLPPKTSSKQVSLDAEMAADVVAFALGQNDFGDLSRYIPVEIRSLDQVKTAKQIKKDPDEEEKRIVTIVCPGRDISYPLSLVKEMGIDTVSADFGQFNTGDVLKSAAKWIDLSDSETIWKE